MLEAPPTIRLPRPEEIPDNPEALERLKRREHANIVEGYKFSHNTTNALPFKFYAAVNIDNSQLWNLFKALAHLLPDNLSCHYHAYEQEVIFSDYKEKDSILRHLDHYKTELTQDCNLALGLNYQTDDKLEEVFIADCKFISVWGNDEIRFRQLMYAFSLNENSDLNFINEFPTVVEPLALFNANAKKTETIMEELNDFFNPK